MLNSNIKGFTLIEVIGSISVFVLGLGALLAVCTQSLGMSKRSEYAYTAYNLAKNHLETLRALNFSELADADETDTVINAQGDVDADGEFTRTTVITTSYGGQSTLAKADVTVYYLFRGNQSLSPMTMTTVIYDD